MSTNDVKVYYWDSCIFIDLLQGGGPCRDAVQQIFTAAEGGQVTIVTSAFTLAEVIKGCPGDPPSDTDEEAIRDLFLNPCIRVVGVDRFIAESARRIAREHGLKPADAIHVATALSAGVTALHTRDGENRKRGILDKHGQIGDRALSIQMPTWPQQTAMVLRAEASEEDEGASQEEG